MSNLKDTINNDIKTAMKAKDQASLRALRAVKSAIILAETAEGRESGAPLTEAEGMALINKQAKQRRDSIEQFRSNDRADLAVGEEEELAVIERYLPAQLSEDDIKAKITEIIAQTGASSMKDMGRVMGMASKAMAGQADGKVIADLVKKTLMG
ncbi:MAG: GatB/YqeY domain-containing protein [Bacteroidia bacterium]